LLRTDAHPTQVGWLFASRHEAVGFIFASFLQLGATRPLKKLLRRLEPQRIGTSIPSTVFRSRDRLSKITVRLDVAVVKDLGELHGPKLLVIGGAFGDVEDDLLKPTLIRSVQTLTLPVGHRTP